MSSRCRSAVLLLLRRLGVLLVLLEAADLVLHLLVLLLRLLLLLGVLLLHLLGHLLELLLQLLLLLFGELLVVDLLGELLELLLGLLEVVLLQRLAEVLGHLVLGELLAHLAHLLLDLGLVRLGVLGQRLLGLGQLVEQLLLGDLAVLGVLEQLLELVGELVELGHLVALGDVVELGEDRLDVRLLVGIDLDRLVRVVTGVLGVDDGERHRADRAVADARRQQGVAERRVGRDLDGDRVAAPIEDGDRAVVVARAHPHLGTERHVARRGVNVAELHAHDRRADHGTRPHIIVGHRRGQTDHQVRAVQHDRGARRRVVGRHAVQVRGAVGDRQDQAGGDRADREEPERGAQVLGGAERGRRLDVGARHGADAVADRRIDQIGGDGLVAVQVVAACERDRRRQPVRQLRRAVDPSRHHFVLDPPDGGDDAADNDQRRGADQQADAGRECDHLGADREHRGQRTCRRENGRGGRALGGPLHVACACRRHGRMTR